MGINRDMVGGLRKGGGGVMGDTVGDWRNDRRGVMGDHVGERKFLGSIFAYGIAGAKSNRTSPEGNILIGNFGFGYYST